MDTAICWFRQDLRVTDNPALHAASKHGKVLPLYILDTCNAKDYFMGAASQWWLHYSLEALDKSLDNSLSLYQGDPIEILLALVDHHKVSAVYWNRCYEPWQVIRDQHIKQKLTANGITVVSYNASLLWEPWEITKEDGTPYKVFTPFYRKGCLHAKPPRLPLKKVKPKAYVQDNKLAVDLKNLNLLPKLPWGDNLRLHWQIGEAAAARRFKDFIASGLDNYKEGRNYPDKPYVSRISPYLHFGEISPNQLWYAVNKQELNANIDHFCSELGWREFSYSQLYYNPELPVKNLQKKFDKFPWQTDSKQIQAWQQGITGIPIVDAGMRELWQTGYVHNRVRMIVGSFLVKNLQMHWHHGERWFWDTLVDADLANNSASWQWVAGCGADAAPYFRIFNCVTQGQKFDKDGVYVRKFVPEIAKLPNKFLFNPWEAPLEILQQANIQLGKDYPNPIVDLQSSRESALLAFKSLSPEPV